MEDRMSGISFYMETLEVLMQELFDPAVDFEADPSDDRYCRLCPFSYMCR
jgi:hypothetical protein